MTTTRSTRAAARSRRRFLKVAMLGAAAAVATSVLPDAGEAATARRRRKAAPSPVPTEHPAAGGRGAALEAEITKQKHATSDLLKTIRDYELPAGSEMAFVFTPSKAPKRAAGGGAR